MYKKTIQLGWIFGGLFADLLTAPCTPFFLKMCDQIMFLLKIGGNFFQNYDGPSISSRSSCGSLTSCLPSEWERPEDPPTGPTTTEARPPTDSVDGNRNISILPFLILHPWFSLAMGSRPDHGWHLLCATVRTARIWRKTFYPRLAWSDDMFFGCSSFPTEYCMGWINIIKPLLSTDLTSSTVD